MAARRRRPARRLHPAAGEPQPRGQHPARVLERKARFISQVMHGRFDTRDISDIGGTALSFSEVKALATGDPLLMDKAEATPRWPGCSAPNAPTKDALRQAIDHCEAEIARLTRLAGHIAAGVKRRQDTRGAHFTMTVGERRYDKRADAGQHLEQLAEGEISALTGLLERTVHAIGRRRHPSEAVR